MEAVEFEDHVTVPNKAPLCAEYVPLEFSMHSFEHLEVIIGVIVVIINHNKVEKL